MVENHIGKNESVKLFNQKSVICFENLYIYTSHQSGHQCICENYSVKWFNTADYAHNNSNKGILKDAVCRTYFFPKTLFPRF